MAARQHLVHLHSTSKVGSIANLTYANLQVGELAMYNPTEASATTIYTFNANKSALAEFKTDAYYQDIFKTKLDSGEIAKYTPIGTSADTSATTSYYGVKAYAQQYADAKVNALNATLSAGTNSVITSITQTNGEITSAGTSTFDLKKTSSVNSPTDTYQLSLGGNKIGEDIVIYKDSALESVGLSGETLYFNYKLANGTTTSFTIDVQSYLTEVEAESLAGKGLDVDKRGDNPVLNIVADNEDDTRKFLVIGDDTIGLKGIQTAIDTARNSATSYTETNFTKLGNSGNTSSDKTYYGLKKYTEEVVGQHNNTNIVVNSGSSSYVSISATATGHGITFDVKDTIKDNFALLNHYHDASAITAGTLDINRIPTGLNNLTVALGNHNHDTKYLPKSQELTVQLKGSVTGEGKANLSADTLTVSGITVSDDSHKHTSEFIKDRITGGTLILSNSTGLTNGKAVYEFVTGAITKAAYDDPLTGTTSGDTGSYITIKHSVNNIKQLTTELDETSLSTALNNKAPNNHATTADTYGLGTVKYYGHVQLKTSDVSDITGVTNGIAAASFHNHDKRYDARYLPITQKLKLSGDITGENTITGGVTTSLSTNWKNTINSKLSEISIDMHVGTNSGLEKTKRYIVSTINTVLDLTKLSIDCGEY
jgi:hypothetical protein